MTLDSVQTTITLAGLNQQRGSADGLDGVPVVSDWSYSAGVRVEASAAGQSCVHTIDLPLEKWQRDELVKAILKAHEMLSARLEEMRAEIENVLGKGD